MMELDASVVNWETVTRKVVDGYSGALDEGGPYLPQPPWPSDSCVQYAEVGKIYQLLRESLPESVRSNADSIFPALISWNFAFPQDLADLEEYEEDEITAGSLSPKTVADLAVAFEKLDYAALDSAYDAILPDLESRKLQICRLGPGRDVFTGYIRQWDELIRLAAKHEAGVLVFMT